MPEIQNIRHRVFLKGGTRFVIVDTLAFEDNGLSWLDAGRLTFYPWHMIEGVQGLLVEDDDPEWYGRMELHPNLRDPSSVADAMRDAGWSATEIGVAMDSRNAARRMPRPTPRRK